MTNLFTCFSSSKVCQGSPKSIRLLLVLFMVLCLGVGNVWGANQTYTLVSNLSTLTNSDNILIVAYDGSNYYALKNNQVTSNSNLACTQVTISSNTITADLETDYTWYPEYKDNVTISSTSYRRYYFKSTKGNWYLWNSGNTGSQITTKNTTDDTYNIWVVGYKAVNNSDQGCYGLWNENTSRMFSVYNSATRTFRAYQSGNFNNIDGHDISIYKKGSSCSSPASALAISAAETTINAGTKTQLSTTGGNGSTITYSVTSSNSTYASIDGDNKFSATQAGTYIVQASQDDNSGTCGGTSTVDITVRYQVKWSVNEDDTYDEGSPTMYIGTHNTKVSTLPTDPTPSMCDGVKRFAGWTTSSSYSHASTPPGTLFRTASAAPNVTDNVTYYAVFANVSDSTTTYDLISTTGALETGKQYVIGHKTSGGDYYYMPNAGATSNPTLSSMTITGTQITSTVTNAMLWTLRSSGVEGYGYKWESVASSTNYLATVSQTADKIRVGAAGTYDKNAWNITTDATYGWALKSNGTYTSSGDTKTGKYAVIFDATTWKVYADKSTNALYGAKFVIFKKNVAYTYANYATNCTGDQCTTPYFNISAGTYIGQQSVTISCSTKGSTIYYTTDNTTPTSSSTEYTGAITVSSTTTIKAIAIKAGLTNSDVASATYTIRSCKEYSLVADASTLGIGDKIVILSTDGAYALSTTQNKNNYRTGSDDFSLSGSTVRIPDDGTVQPITIEARDGTYWYFNVGADSYLCATSSTDNKLLSSTKANTATNGKWSISLTSSVFAVQDNGGVTHKDLRYNYNSGSPLFNCYTEGSQTAVKVYVHQNTSPTIQTNPTSLSGFSTTYGGSASDAQDVYVSGRNLNGNITVTPPTGYEIKKSSDGSYSSSVTLTPVSNKVSVTLNVRLAAGNNAGDYEGNLTLVGYNSEASTNVALSGTVNCADPGLAFNDDEFELTLSGSSITSASSVVSSPSSGAYTATLTHEDGDDEDALTFDTSTGKFTATAEGIWTVTLSQAANGNYCASDEVECTVYVVCGTPTAPTGLDVSESNDQATISWDAVDGADHYDVLVSGKTSGGDESYTNTFENITSNSTTITGLKGGCTYEYYVSVTNICGKTADSDADEFTTLPYLVTYHSATEDDYEVEVISGESVSAHSTDDCDNGKVFVGWTTSAVAALQQSDPTTNTTGAIASVTANTDLYAVFASQNGYTTATILNEKWNVVEWDGTNKKVSGSYSSWATNFTDAPSTSFKISGTAYQAIVFDVSSARTITSESAYSNLKAIQITGSNRSSFAMNVTVKVSTDKSAWTTVDTKSLGTASNSSPQTLVFALSTKGNYYVRIETEAKSSGNKTGITNIRLFQEQDYYLTDYSTTCDRASTPVSITWSNGEGTTLSEGTQPSSVAVGSDITMPALTKPDYRFDGWKVTINEATKSDIFVAGDTYTVNHPITFTPQWTQVFSVSSPTEGLTSYKDVKVTSTSQTFTTVGMHNAVPSVTLADGTYFTMAINSHAANSSNEDYSYTFTYQPTAYGTGSGAATNTTTATITDARTGVVSSPITLRGRSLPEEFVIAVKKGDQWVALPNNLASTSSQPSIVPQVITVDNTTTPTAAVYAPSTTAYKATGRNNAAKYVRGIRFTTTGSNYLQTAKADGTYNMWLSTTNSDSAQVWYLSSTDFGAYTLKMDSKHNGTKQMGIYTGGYIGYHGSPSSSDIYLLPITNKYTEIPATVHEWGVNGVVVQPTTPSDLTSVTSAAMNVGSASPTDATATAVNVAMGTAKYVRVYAAGATVGDVANEGKLLYVHWKNGESEVGVSQVTIPCVVATSNDMHSIASTKGAWSSKSEVHVLPGVTLEANAGSFSGDGALSVSKMEIYPGATLKVSTGTFNATTLRLRCGWTRAGDKKYDVARVYIADDAALTKTTASMDYDIYEKSDGKHYYPLAVPFKTQVSTIDYADEALASASIYGKHIGIDKYDGANRAANGATDENWVQMGESDYLEPGKGYMITAVSSKGSAIIRVPLVFDNDWTADGEKATINDSYYKNQVSVTAYSGAASTGGGANNRNAGWNMLGVPYMSCFDASDASADPSDAFIKGMLNFLTGEYTESANVYVNVPVHDFSEYIQKSVSEAKLLPGWSFFVQIGKNGTLSFATAGQEPSSTLPIYAPQREDMPVVKTGIVLSRGDKSDNTTLLISDKYSANEYEINADLEKMFGNGYTLATYSLSQNTRLAYNAMSTTDARQVIPIGFRAPEDGEYTFSLNPRYAEAAIERVDLIDYQTGEVTNLMMNEYTFTTVRTQDDERFALNVVPRAEVPTGVDDNSQKSKVESRKIVIDDHVFIIYDGLLYDATGKRVTKINK